MNATYKAGVKPLGYQQLTVAGSAVGLTVPKNAIRAVIGVESYSIRWRDDGTDPTASVGMLQKLDTTVEIYGPQSIKTFKAIRVTSDSATLNISYYG